MNITRFDYLVKTAEPIDGVPSGNGYALLRLVEGEKLPEKVQVVATVAVTPNESSWPEIIKQMGADAFAQALPDGIFGDYA